MPTVRKLTSDEVQAIQDRGKGLRQLIEEQYDRFLADYEIGDYGEAQIAENEKRLTVRNRFKAAAERRGVALRFIRTTGDTMRFKVIARSDLAGRSKQNGVVASSSSTPGTKRGPGRPKKSS
jgi:hypothetical protein